MHRLRTKILATTAALVVVSQLGTVSAVLYTAHSDVSKRANAALLSGAELLQTTIRARGRQLGSAVEALAADFGIKQAIAAGNRDTVGSALENHAARADAQLAFAVGKQGELINVAGKEAGLFSGSNLDAEEFAKPGRRILVADGHAFEVFTVPVRAPVTIAWLSVGYRLDDSYMQTLHDLSGLDVSLVQRLGDTATVHASSNPTITADEKIAASMELNAFLKAATVDLGGESYLAIRAPLLNSQRDFSLLIAKSMADAMAPYRLLRTASVALAALPLLAALLGAVLLSRALTKPVGRLMKAARRIQSGNYSTPVDIRSGDELGEFGTAFNAMQREIAEREQRIAYQASHDTETGLYNKRRAAELLTGQVADAWERNQSVGVAVIRLGALNGLASSLGDEPAQGYLREVARQLLRFASPSCLIARLDNDDFLVALTEDDDQRIRNLTQDILGHLGRSVRLPSMNIAVNPCAGIALFPRDANNATNLLLRASVAVNEASTEGRPLRFYRNGDHESRVRNLRLLQDLRRAAAEDEFVLYCQPKICLSGETVSGGEALVRWQHPEYGLLQPVEFIPLIERSGNTGLLTRWVLAAAAKQLARWNEAGLELGIAVNLSSQDLLDDELAWYVHDIVKEHNLAPEHLTLEVTEEAMIRDFAHANSTLLRLHELGVQIAIDDFGTGYSSLSQLKNLPAQELKLDRSFIAGLDNDPTDRVIASTAIELAKRLGLRTVAEGVANTATLVWLRAQGVDQAQGFYWSPPMPAAEFTDWVATFGGGATVVTQGLTLIKGDGSQN